MPSVQISQRKLVKVALGPLSTFGSDDDDRPSLLGLGRLASA